MAEAMHLETIELEWPAPEIARITLNRPTAGNSLSSQLVADLVTAAGAVRFTEECKVVLITGSGRFFCAGADLKERNRPASWIWELRRAFDLIEDLPMPTVALINGSCMGGGTELAIACDFRIALSSVSMGLPEIQFGALPAAMTGDHIPAPKALELGLLEECVDEDLAGAGLAFAEKLALRANYALRTTKFLVNRGVNMPLRDALELDYQLIDTMGTPEQRRAEREKATARNATYAKIFS
jgi:enoyl-CoA hydratase/carnithine racemase